MNTSNDNIGNFINGRKCDEHDAVLPFWVYYILPDLIYTRYNAQDLPVRGGALIPPGTMTATF